MCLFESRRGSHLGSLRFTAGNPFSPGSNHPPKPVHANGQKPPIDLVQGFKIPGILTPAVRKFCAWVILAVPSGMLT